MSVQETKVDKTFIKLMNEYRQPDKSVGLIEACSKNVIVFAKHMLDMELYSWQVDFLTKIQNSLDGKSDEREFVAITSRQIGKSTLLAIFSIWAAVFNKKPGTKFNNTLIGIVSASDDQSKTLMAEIRKYVALGDVFMATQYIDEDDKPLFGESFFSSMLSREESNNQTTISFVPHKKSTHGDYLLKGSKSGSMIRCWPPTQVVLGKTLTIAMIDEAGKTDKITDQFVNDYFLHTGSSTDCVFIYTSTPWVQSGHFYRMVDPDDVYGSRGVVVLYTIDAIKEENHEHWLSVHKRFIEPFMKDGKKDEVQRGYYCRFVKGEQSYFDPEDVRSVFYEDEVMLNSFKGPCDMGVDFGGQVNSRTVTTISYLDDDDVVHRIAHRVYEIGKDITLIEDIAHLKQSFNIQRIIYDDCPASFTFVQQMKEKGWDLQPMSFRAEKVSRYGSLRVAMKRRNIHSYLDEDLKTEMYALENTPGSRQSNIQHAPGYSDDMLDSFLMSVYFFIDDETNMKFFEW